MRYINTAIRMLLPVCAVVAWGFFVASTLPGAMAGMMDFGVYYDSGRALLNGVSPYAVSAHQYSPFPFQYPPIFAFLMLPLAILPYAYACPIWYLLSAVALLAGLLFTNQLLGALRPSAQSQVGRLALLVILAVGFYPVWVDAKLGQVGALVFCLVSGSILALQRSHTRLGGILLGVALVLKPIPALLVPFAWLIGQRRYALGAVMVYSAIQALAFMLAPQLTWAYVRDVVPVIRDHVADANLSLIRLALPLDDPFGVQTLLVWMGAGVLVLVPFVLIHQTDRVPVRMLACGMLICAGACALPMVQSHYLVWLLLPVGCLLFDVIAERSVGAGVLLALAFLLLSQPFRLIRVCAALSGIALPAEALGGIVLEAGVVVLYLGLLAAFWHHMRHDPA